LAHSKSALKRWRQSLERRDRNRSVKSRTRTLLTKALLSIGSEPAESEESVRAAVSALDKAAQKGVIHANAAARAKSRLLKRFNLAQAEAVAAAAATPPSESAPEPPRRRGRAASQPAADNPPSRRARGAQASDTPPADQPPPRRGRRTTS
jgi:small subunit ribosomal protein S20